ncbi:MAG: phosphoribosyltransferase [Armatimonadota bacterium]
METELFRDRTDAGYKLAQQLLDYKDQNTVVLAIPRGGIPVGYEVAKDIDAEFDIILPRKIPIPWNPEAGLGAMSADGTMVLNEALVRGLGMSDDEIKEAASGVKKEIERQTREYRKDRPTPDLAGKTVILVDDGLASGYTMLAAIESARKYNPKSIITAVPVASKSAVKLIKPRVDKLLVLITGDSLPFAVAGYYLIWQNLTDENVINYLERAYKINP